MSTSKNDYLATGKRIVVKIGSALLVAKSGAITRKWLQALADDVAPAGRAARK